MADGFCNLRKNLQGLCKLRGSRWQFFIGCSGDSTQNVKRGAKMDLTPEPNPVAHIELKLRWKASRVGKAGRIRWATRIRSQPDQPKLSFHFILFLCAPSGKAPSVLGWFRYPSPCSRRPGGK